MSKTGYCSLCKHPQALVLNNAINAGKGFTVCLREMEAFDFKFAKATFLKHKEHISIPLLTEAENARKMAITGPRNNRAVLEAIRDIGMQKALEDPDAVNVGHALRAAKILQDAEGKQETVLVLLAKAVQGPMPQLETIEGEYKELTTSEVTD